jgi:hypothetical protein
MWRASVRDFGTVSATALFGLAGLVGPLGIGDFIFLGLMLLLLALTIIGLPLFFMWEEQTGRRRSRFSDPAGLVEGARFVAVPERSAEADPLLSPA